MVMSSPSQNVLSFNMLVIDELEAETRALFTCTTTGAQESDTEPGKENTPPCAPVLKSPSCRRRLGRSSECLLCGRDVDATGEIGKVVSQCTFYGHVLLQSVVE